MPAATAPLFQVIDTACSTQRANFIFEPFVVYQATNDLDGRIYKNKYK